MSGFSMLKKNIIEKIIAKNEINYEYANYWLENFAVLPDNNIVSDFSHNKDPLDYLSNTSLQLSPENAAEKKSNNLFFNYVPISVFELDKFGYFTNLNDFGSSYMGFDNTDLKKQKVHFTDVVSPDDIRTAVKGFQRVFSFQKNYDKVIKIRNRTGLNVPNFVHSTIFKNRSGEMAMRGLAVDISSDEKSIPAGEIIKEILNSANHIILITDSSLNLKFYNNYSDFLLGIGRKKLRKLFEIFTADSVQFFNREILPSLKMNIPYYAEMYCLDRNENMIPVKCAVKNIVSESTEELYYFEIIENKFDSYEENLVEELRYANELLEKQSFEHIILTEKLLKSEAELKNTLKSKNKFFEIIAHDIKSPFNGLLGLINHLKDNYTVISLKELKLIIDAVNDSALHIYDFFQDMFDWAHSQTGRFDIVIEDIKLTEIISDTAAICLASFENKSVSLQNNIIQETYYVKADKYFLKTVLRNLLSNAVKFTEKGGEVKLSAKDKENHIIISISDNGTGIDPAIIPDLFSINVKTSTPGTKSEQGTGLGLVICRDFIELMQGTIEIESEPGKGTKVFVSLPKA